MEEKSGIIALGIKMKTLTILFIVGILLVGTVTAGLITEVISISDIKDGDYSTKIIEIDTTKLCEYNAISLSNVIQYDKDVPEKIDVTNSDVKFDYKLKIQEEKWKK